MCFSSRELKCSCQRFDDETIGQEKLSEIITQNVDLNSPQNDPKVTHVMLRDCNSLDVIIDPSNFDQNRYQLTDVSFVNIRTSLKIEFRFNWH